MTTVRLWWLLRRRSRVDSSDPARMASALAVIAFAVTTAMTLVVFGGFQAFRKRADAGQPDGYVYVLLAGFAALLLLVPLSTLGAAAARLVMARRDARLAALRLAGATTAQVSLLTVLDAATQALTGALIGIAGYAALLPLVAQLRFQGRTFDVAELWVGILPLLAVFAAVVSVALVSVLTSLRRVSISPLGVSARVTPPHMRAARVLALAAAVVAAFVLSVTTNNAGMAGIIIVMIVIAAGMATLNLVGPFVLGVVGRVVASGSRSVSTLLAARRLADDPRAAWRSVGGLALATFIAGITSLTALLSTPDADSADATFSSDIATGGLLTLAIAGILAGVATGVLQSGRVIDQRQQYRSLLLAGTAQRQLDRARMRETLIPLAASMGIAVSAMLLLVVPFTGAAAFGEPAVMIRFAVCAAGAAALGVLGAAASGVVARKMVALDT